jgi:hypothetical protein
MRQIFFSAGKSIFLLLGISFYTQAQIAKSSFDSTEPEGKFKNNKLYKNDIDSRARRDFSNNYKNVTDEKWTVTDEGFNVNFTIDEVKYSVRYDKKGYRLFTLRKYSEKNLPKNIRTLVRSNYFDYNIKSVDEISKPLMSIVYVVLLEGDKEWIKVKVQDGEMTEVEKLEK